MRLYREWAGKAGKQQPPPALDPRDPVSVGRCVEHLYPETALRSATLRFLGTAIDGAYRFGPDKWRVTVRRRRIRLRVGAVAACELVAGQIRVAVPWKALSAQDRTSLPLEGRMVREVGTRPSMALWGFDAERFLAHQERLQGWDGDAWDLLAADVEEE